MPKGVNIRETINERENAKKSVCGKRTFMGFDTETINNGQIVIIANSNKEYLIKPTIEEILEFLLMYQSNRYLGYFFNLDYDTKAIIMTIAKHNEKLNDIKNFIAYNHLSYGQYTISYIPGKKLTVYDNLHLKEIKYKNNMGIWVKRNTVSYDRKAEYYDIAQFYLDKYGKRMSLETASQEFLGYGKLEVDDIGNIDIDKLEIDNEYKELLISYCIRDSYLVKRLCLVFYNKIKDFINIRKLLSPANISQKWILKNLKDKGIKNEFTNSYILQYEKEILESYYGGRFETFKKGKPDSEKCYLPDINSAYPFIMSQFRGLTGQATLTGPQDLETEKCYPLINITIEPTDLYLNPLAHKVINTTESKLVYFPSTNKPIDKWVTQWSLELLDLMDIDYSINKIIKFWTTDNLLFDFINELYHLKKTSEQYRTIAKIILNSLYGKTIERTNRITLTSDRTNSDFMIINGYVYFFKKTKKVRGTLYNPLWGTMITDFCRYYVVKPIIKQHLQKNLWQIATDSILLDKKPDLDYGKKLGQWSLDEIHNPIIYGNGILQHDVHYKCRGFPCKDINEFENLIRTKEWERQRLIPLQHYNKHGFDKIHSFQFVKKQFSIRDRKRLFIDLEPQDLMETKIDSSPLMLGS